MPFPVAGKEVDFSPGEHAADDGVAWLSERRLDVEIMLVLQSLGYRNVRSLAGGIVAWNQAGLPIATP